MDFSRFHGIRRPVSNWWAAVYSSGDHANTWTGHSGFLTDSDDDAWEIDSDHGDQEPSPTAESTATHVEAGSNPVC